MTNLYFVEKIEQGSQTASVKEFSLPSLVGLDSRTFEFSYEDMKIQKSDDLLRQAFGLYRVNSVQTRSYSSKLEVKVFGELNIRVVFDTYYLQLAGRGDVSTMYKLLTKAPYRVEVAAPEEQVDPVKLEATIGTITEAILARVSF